MIKAVKILDPFFNPTLEILPLVLFMVLEARFHYMVAMGGGLALFSVFVLIALFLKKSVPSYMLIVTGVVFTLDAILSKVLPLNPDYFQFSTVRCEILLMIVLEGVKMIGKPLRVFVKKKKNDRWYSNLNKLDEFLHVSSMFRVALGFHLLSLLIYRLLPLFYQHPWIENFLFRDLFLLLFVIILMLESFRLGIIIKEMNNEDWLPIVNEGGGVIGRVASSESIVSSVNYLHPVVRVAITYRGMLFLKKRPSFCVLDPDKIDYPFERYVYYRQSLADAVKEAMRENSDLDLNLPVKFVFKYIFRNSVSDRLVYLFTCHIKDEATFDLLSERGGKIWTDKQILENMNSGIFSEPFEKEYEILENTVLLADRICLKKEAVKVG